MTIYVLRDGRLINKDRLSRVEAAGASDMPSPMLSPRLEPFESPVTGKEVSSWRDRDRDMKAADAVDPRDLPRRPFEKRKADNDNARQSDTH
jgi:hypothetical protein